MLGQKVKVWNIKGVNAILGLKNIGNRKIGFVIFAQLP